MGAYDNPNVNVGVDKTSGQNFGRMLAGVGQNIAKSMTEADKIEAKSVAQYNKLLEANNVITNTEEVAAVARSNDINTVLTDSGMKGADLEAFQKEIAASLTSYKDALINQKKNIRRKTYKGKDEDLETIRISEKFYKNLPDLLKSNQAAISTADQNNINGDASANTNPLFRSFVGIGKKTEEGEIGYKLVINPTTGDYDMNMIASGPVIDKNKKFLDELSNVERDYEEGEIMEVEKDPVTSSPYTVSMTELADTYNNPDNENYNRFFASKVKADNLVLTNWEKKANDPDNPSAEGTPYQAGSTTLKEENTNILNVTRGSTSVKGGTENMDIIVPDAANLIGYAQEEGSRLWNEISGRRNGNISLQSMILSDPNITEKNGKYFYTVAGSGGVMYTQNKELRNSNGKLTDDTTEVEISLPKFDLLNEKPGNFTEESQVSIQNYLTHKAFSLTGVYTDPKVVQGSIKKIDPPEIKETSTNQFGPMIADLNAYEGSTMSSADVIKNINTFEPDGTRALTLAQTISFYKENLSKMSGEDKAASEATIKELNESGNKNSVYLQMGNEMPRLMNGFDKSGRITKQNYANKIVNEFDTMTEQKDFRVGTIEGVPKTKAQINQGIINAEMGLEMATTQEEKAMFERRLAEYKAMQK